jgi:hypothetical protein
MARKVITLDLKAEFSDATDIEHARHQLDVFRETVRPSGDYGITLSEEYDRQDVGKAALRESLLVLVEFLQEAHEPDRSSVVGGRNHAGDGAAGCSYCEAIKEAKRSLKKY